MIQIGSILGVLLAIFILSWSIISKTSEPMLFLNTPSLGIVLGGLLATNLMTYKFKGFLLMLEGFKDLLVSPVYDSHAMANDIMRYVELVRNKGVTALESEASNVKNPVIKEFLEIAAAGYKKEEILHIIEEKIDSDLMKIEETITIFDTLAKNSPAFGMFGTVIGIIIMLQHLASDPSMIGPALSVALVTTFYGIAFAYLVFAPIADKTRQKQYHASKQYEVLLEGVQLILDKRNEIYAKDALNAHLAEKNKLK